MVISAARAALLSELCCSASKYGACWDWGVWKGAKRRPFIQVKSAFFFLQSSLTLMAAALQLRPLIKRLRKRLTARMKKKKGLSSEGVVKAGRNAAGKRTVPWP